jgi:hypothetical protein
MRGLAWDDETGKNSYISRLKAALGSAPFHISLDVEKTETRFLERFQREEEQLDFVITDLQGRDESKPLEPGLTITRRLADRVQVIVVTNHSDRVDRNRLGIPQNVLIKSKDLLPNWMADEVVGDLRRLGIYFRSDRVFLIYGRDRQTPGLQGEVEHFLRDTLHLEVEIIRGGNLKQEIFEGLLMRMAECGAFVVLCTPDDEVRTSDGALVCCQPRQNVLLEMGLAAGLGRGIERLVILQKWGPELNQQAQFPSDLGGVVPIRMLGNFEHYQEQLKAELRKRGVGLKTS